MNSEETRQLVESINERTSISRWIYCIGFVVIMIEVGIGIFLIRQGFKKAIENHSQIQVQLAAYGKKSEENAAAVKATNDQLLNYIALQVKIINKLQKDNPDIIVPKGVIPLPPGLPQPSDKDLDRPKSEHPKAGKHSTTKTIIIKQPKPKSTPKQFKWPWQSSKSTR